MRSHAERGNDRAELCGRAVVPAGTGGGAGGGACGEGAGFDGVGGVAGGGGVGLSYPFP